MPCPRCDTELELDLSRAADPACPACGLPLLPVCTAGIGRRIAAAIVDALAVAAVAVPVQWVLTTLVDPPPLLGPARTALGWLLEILAVPIGPAVVRALPVLCVLYLYLVLHWAGTGQTVGGRWLRVRVVDRYGAPPHPVRTLLRAAGHAVGGLVGGIGWVFAAFDLERRAFHDKVAGTWVVYEEAEA